MSFILATSAGKSHLVHVIDTPGHVNFLDEVAAAIRLVDGILLVVDVLEGVRSCVAFTFSSQLTSCDSPSVPGYGGHREDNQARSPGGCKHHSRCKQARQANPRVEGQTCRRLLQD